MSGEIFRKQKQTKETKMRIEKQLFDKSTITDAYQKDAAVTAGAKCLQYYMESNYAVEIGSDALVRLSRISPQMPEPDFELKSEEEINGMGKIARSKYKSKVEKFIKDKTGRWFEENEKTVKLNVEGIVNQKAEFQSEIRKKVAGREDILLEKAAYYEEQDETKKAQMAYDFVEKNISEASEYANPEDYKDVYSYAVDRADAMRLALMSGDIADEELLKQIGEHEKKLQVLCGRKEALASIKSLFSSNDLRDKNISENIRLMFDQINQMDAIVEAEGEALEELVVSKLEQREPVEIDEENQRKARLSRYVSANDLEEFRYKVAKDLRKKTFEKGTLNSQKAEFELEKKTEWAKNLMEANKKKAREMSIKNEVVRGVNHDEEKLSVASYKRVVTLAEAVKYKMISNGYVTYIPLENHPGLYVLKQTLPVEADVKLEVKPFGMTKYNPRRAHNTLVRHIVTILEKASKETDEEAMNNLAQNAELLASASSLERYLAYLGLSEDELSEDEVEDIKHAIIYIKQNNPFEDRTILPISEFILRAREFEKNRDKYKAKCKETIVASGKNSPFSNLVLEQTSGYLRDKYMKNGEFTAEFDSLLDQCFAEMTIEKDKQLEVFLALKNLSSDSEVIPVINECRNNSDMYMKFSVTDDNLNQEGKFMSMEYKFKSFADEKNKAFYYDYLNKYFPEFYKEVTSIEDPVKQKNKLIDRMKEVTTYEYHYIPKIGENENEILTVEGFAPETSQFFVTPLTMDAAIGTYNKKTGEKPKAISELFKQYKTISSVEKYYNNDKCIITDDKSFLVSILKYIFWSID